MEIKTIDEVHKALRGDERKPREERDLKKSRSAPPTYEIPADRLQKRSTKLKKAETGQVVRMKDYHSEHKDPYEVRAQLKYGGYHATDAQMPPTDSVPTDQNTKQNPSLSAPDSLYEPIRQQEIGEGGSEYDGLPVSTPGVYSYAAKGEPEEEEEEPMEKEPVEGETVEEEENAEKALPAMAARYGTAMAAKKIKQKLGGAAEAAKQRLRPKKPGVQNLKAVHQSNLKRSLSDPTGGAPALLKSIAVLAAGASTMRVSSDQVWNFGMEEDAQESFKSLLNSFPPRMWQFLKRVANKSIDTREAIRHIAECIGEMSKSLSTASMSASTEGPKIDYTVMGADVVDDSAIDHMQVAMDKALSEAKKEHEKYQKSHCPTHAYTSQGWGHGTNPGTICNCAPPNLGLLAADATKILRSMAEKDKSLKGNLDLFGVDKFVLQTYFQNAAL